MRRLVAGLVSALLVLALAGAPATAGPSLTVECTDPSGPATTLCEVYLNPDVHHGSLGTVLFHATKATKATIALPDGPAHIAIRASANVSGGVNTSVLVVNLGTPCPKAGWVSLSYQAWWADTGQDPTFGSRHEHIDNLCWPVDNLIVNGPQTFTFNVQLHNQPAGARLTRVRVDDFLGSSSVRRFEQTTGLPQPDAAGNLVAAFSVPIDLSKLATGRHEFRFGVYVTQPTKKVQLLSSRSEICIRGCSPSYRSSSSFPFLQGNGAWYEKNTNPGYIDARVRSLIPVAP